VQKATNCAAWYIVKHQEIMGDGLDGEIAGAGGITGRENIIASKYNIRYSAPRSQV